MSLGKWLAISREQPVLSDIRRYCWEPGGTHSTVGFPQEYTQVMCQDFAPEFNPELINRPSGLVNRLRLLCVLSGDTASLLCVPPGLFDQALSQLALSAPGILVAAGVHFDAFGPGIGDSVRTCWCQLTPVMGTSCP